MTGKSIEKEGDWVAISFAFSSIWSVRNFSFDENNIDEKEKRTWREETK